MRAHANHDQQSPRHSQAAQAPVAFQAQLALVPQPALPHQQSSPVRRTHRLSVVASLRQLSASLRSSLSKFYNLQNKVRFHAIYGLRTKHDIMVMSRRNGEDLIRLCCIIAGHAELELGEWFHGRHIHCPVCILAEGSSIIIHAYSN
jgi:hypothetical protein